MIEGGSDHLPPVGLEGRLSETTHSSSTLITSSAQTLLAIGSVMFAGLLRGKVMAILLGTAGVGVIGNLSAYVSLGVTAGSALSGQGATRATAASRALGDERETNLIVRYTIWSGILGGLGLLAISVLSAPVLSTLLIGSADYAPLLIVASLAIPLGLVAGCFQQIAQGYLRIASIAKATIAATAIGLVVGVLLVVVVKLPGGVLSLLVAPASLIVILIATEPWMASRLRQPIPEQFRWKSIRPIIGLGVGTAFLGIVSLVVSLLIRADIVSVMGLEIAGVYQPVVSVSDVYLEAVISATSLYLFPRLTALLVSGERAQAGHELGAGLRLVTVVTAPLLMVGIGFADQLIAVLYSSHFAQASLPLAIQMVGSVAKVVAWSVGLILLPLGRYRAWLVIGLLNVSTKLVVTHLGIPLIGLNGAALGYDLAWTVSAVGTLVVVGRSGIKIPGGDLRIVFLGLGGVAAVFFAWMDSHLLGAITAVSLVSGWFLMTRRDWIALLHVGREAILRRGTNRVGA